MAAITKPKQKPYVGTVEPDDKDKDTRPAPEAKKKIITKKAIIKKEKAPKAKAKITLKKAVTARPEN